MSRTLDGDGKLTHQNQPLDVERAVHERYASASQAPEAELCCPVVYDPQYLRVLPPELIERDYGCGDPSQHVQRGEVVLDLGSGGGKICYIASQVVGPEGRVIGVDMNDSMLALARKYQGEIGDHIGWHNVEFHKGRIQDLALDFDRFESILREQPIDSVNGWLEAQRLADRMRREEPMIADDSIDVVISNCVLNLVTPADRRKLFEEVFRVLRRGGRAVISDIVCDEPVPDRLKNDPKLWSGCISGAFLEHEMLEVFEQAGFYGIEILSRQEEPWATVEGIEFRSITVRAYQGKEGPCMDHKQAVVYQGPWKSVTDDDGNLLRRGVRTAVCEKTFKIYTSTPYRDQIIPIPPREPVVAEQAKPFDCRRSAVRDPKETKGTTYSVTELPISSCCGPDECC
jgi:ubiquinone/menaquinone biosynthesis C-methylase UbiE